MSHLSSTPRRTTLEHDLYEWTILTLRRMEYTMEYLLPKRWNSDCVQVHSVAALLWARTAQVLNGLADPGLDTFPVYAGSLVIDTYDALLNSPVLKNLLGQSFSNFLKLQLFDSIPHVVVIPTVKSFLLLLHNWKFAAVMNHNAHIWSVDYLNVTPVEELFNPKGIVIHGLRAIALGSHLYKLLNRKGREGRKPM